MNFAESEAYLYSLGNEVEAMKLGLDNIRKLLAALGNPEKNYLKVQVAGTNGKGSVCAFLNSICLEAGIKSGMFTSPHLVSVTERVKIDGVDISEEKFAEYATQIRNLSERLVADGALENVPTFFEQVTAIALVAFAEANVKLAIIETGLGGRFDAVTAANAEICAITRIDYDHQKQLGETLDEIAAEKAAIIRDDSKVVLSRQSKAVERVLVGRCHETGVEAVWASADIQIKNEPDIARAIFGSITSERARYGLLESWDMLGRHQFENAALAIAIAETLVDIGFKLTADDITVGIMRTRHPGRLEWIGNFLLDGAHNIAGAKALAAFIDEFVPRPITIIFGAMRDKNVVEIAETLWPRTERVILTSSKNSRALSPEELFEMRPRNLNELNLVFAESAEEAIKVAKSLTSENETILITGSLYLVGEARELLTRSVK